MPIKMRVVSLGPAPKDHPAGDILVVLQTMDPNIGIKVEMITYFYAVKDYKLGMVLELTLNPVQ